MRVSLLLLAALARSIVAEVTLTITASSTTTTSVAYTTKLSNKPAKQPIPTTNATSTLTPRIILIISASTSVSTITPKPVTITTTKTAKTTVTTTATPFSNTYSTTFTTTVTTTNTTTSTVKSTTTVTESTTSTSVSHIPTTPSFVDIENSTEETDYADAKKKQDAYSPLKSATFRNYSMSKKRTNPSPKYPTSVYCTKYIQITYTKKIVAVKPTTTVTAKPSTSTISTTTTQTSTSTVCPPRVTVTSSFTTTATAAAETTTTTTKVATTTTTITEIVSSTQHDACLPTNVLGPRLGTGEYVVGVAYNDRKDVLESLVENAVQCCEACIQNPSCIASQYKTNTGDCFLAISITDETCADPNSGYLAGNLFADDEDGIEDSTVVSNGNCGIIYRH